MNEIKVNPDGNMRAARRIELQQRRTMLAETIRDQEAASGEGDQSIVALRAKKIEEHRYELTIIDAELDAIHKAG